MKVEESFKDLKSLLDLEKVMAKTREHMEKVVALMLLAYAIGLVTGEALRDQMYGAEKGASDPPGPKETRRKEGSLRRSICPFETKDPAGEGSDPKDHSASTRVLQEAGLR